MTPPRREHGAKRRTGRPTEAEILAAKRIVKRSERRRVEEAERLSRDARRVLEAAASDAESRRTEAERVLAEARTAAERVLAEARTAAERVLAEAERIRADAARVVAEAGPDVASMTDARNDEADRRRREAALSAVDPSAGDVAVLLGLLGDDLSADVRLAAVGALARAPEPDQLGALGLALGDPEPLVRSGALDTLAVAGTSRGAAQVLAAAEDDDEVVRASAYRRLGGAPSWVLWMALGRCSRCSELLSALDDVPASEGVVAEVVLERLWSPDADDRILALELSGHLGTPELRAEAIHALADSDAEVRRAAAAQLGGCDEAVPALVATLGNDPDPSVRSQAAQALTAVGTHDAIGAFVGALQDPDADVRHRAVEALVRHPSAGLAHRLAAELTSATLDSVGEVLLGMPHGREALATAVADGPPERASAATELLERLDGDTGLPADPGRFGGR